MRTVRWRMARAPAAQHRRQEAERDGADGGDLELSRLEPEHHPRRAPGALGCGERRAGRRQERLAGGSHADAPR
jgi:hypothetical protein